MKPIETINPVIGDESFVAAFGRLPTEHDDPRTRVATHVGYVARQLRDRRVSDPRRTLILDVLDRYVAAGEFPDSEADRGLLPTFLDPHSNVRCAVAHLVETTAGTELMCELDRDHHNDYIADLVGDPRFIAWAETSGLTPLELEMIQPSYPPPPPPDVLYIIAAEGEVSVHDNTPTSSARGSSQLESLTSMGTLDASLRYVTRERFPVGKVSAELDGKIGITNDDHSAYAVAAKLGADTHERPFRLEYSVGLAVDAYGPELPRAVTIPVDGSFELEHGQHDLFGIHGGPRFSITGDRGTGANLGLEYRLRDHFCDQGRFDPRDLVISVDANWIGDHTFIGLTVGFGNPRARSWWE